MLKNQNTWEKDDPGQKRNCALHNVMLNSFIFTKESLMHGEHDDASKWLKS